MVSQVRRDRSQRLKAYAQALTDAVRASSLSQAEIVRQAVIRGAGTLSATTLGQMMKSEHKPNDPETVWALEEVLGCDGQLSGPLGFLPASQRTTPQAVHEGQAAVERATGRGR